VTLQPYRGLYVDLSVLRQEAGDAAVEEERQRWKVVAFLGPWVRFIYRPGGWPYNPPTARQGWLRLRVPTPF
jgi:hypothetical protein